MEDSRIKEIMAQTPYPDSMSVYLALRQVANEVEQQVRREFGQAWGNMPIQPAASPLPLVTYFSSPPDSTAKD